MFAFYTIDSMAFSITFDFAQSVFRRRARNSRFVNDYCDAQITMPAC
jgi:hypothetical protein